MTWDHIPPTVDIVAVSDIFSLSQLCSQEALQIALTLISGHLYL